MSPIPQPSTWHLRDSLSFSPQSQTREEGKSLLHEILKLKGLEDSSGKQGLQDLTAIDLDSEISPINPNVHVHLV